MCLYKFICLFKYFCLVFLLHIFFLAWTCVHQQHTKTSFTHKIHTNNLANSNFKLKPLPKQVKWLPYYYHANNMGVVCCRISWFIWTEIILLCTRRANLDFIFKCSLIYSCIYATYILDKHFTVFILYNRI